MQLTGIHHVTAVSAAIRDNLAFYSGVLGLRLVKRSVNQDDVSAYHLFYADAAGSPGTDLTFFDWAVPREVPGNGSVVRTLLRVRDAEVLAWWRVYLRDNGVAVGEIQQVDGRAALFFEDPEGQRLALLADDGQGPDPVIWDASPVPAQYQIRGLGPVVMSVVSLHRTDEVLRVALRMKPVRQYSHPAVGEEVHVYQMGEGGPHAELHLAVQPDLPRARPGAGGVHHVAFRTPNEEEYHAWTKHLASLGQRTSGEIDRYYFRSLYFREPGGILFEIATDGPGFAVDEDAATLGDRVALPPFLEPHREQILAGLKPLE